MKKYIILFTSILVTISFLRFLPESNVECGLTSPSGNVTWIWVEPGGSASVVTESQFNNNLTEQLLRENPGTTLGAPGQGGGQGGSASPAPAQPAATPASNTAASVPAAPKEKLTVYFTDAFVNGILFSIADGI